MSIHKIHEYKACNLTSPLHSVTILRCAVSMQQIIHFRTSEYVMELIFYKAGLKTGRDQFQQVL
jgi:hypothetical protein